MLSPARLRWTLALVAAVLLAALHARTVGYPYLIYDDTRFYFHDRQEPFEEFMMTPVTMASIALEKLLFGLNPAVSHAVNLVLFAAGGAVLVLVTERLLLRLGDGGGRTVLWASFAAALLYMLHPQRVECVAWASARKDLFCALFMGLSVLFYLRHLERLAGVAGPPARPWLTLATLCGAVAAFSKFNAISLPLVFLLLDWLVGRSPGRALWREKIPLAVVCLLSVINTVWAYRSMVNPDVEGQVLFRLVHAGVNYGFYLQRTLMPVDLAPIYIFYEKPGQFARMDVVSAAAAVLLLGGLVVFARKGVKVAVLYYVVTIAPSTGLVEANVISAADRYAHVSLMCLVPLLAHLLCLASNRICALPEAERRSRTAALVAGCVFLGCVLAVLSWRQASIWRSDAALYRHQAEVFPHYIVMENWGVDAARMGAHEQALLLFEKARRLYPENARVYYQMALSYRALGREDLFMAALDRAILLKPDFAQAYLVRALGQQDARRREADLRKAVELNPALKEANNLAIP